MKKIETRRGISLVALIITIIVIIILTGAVILNAVNVPGNASTTVLNTNIATVQDAVTIKMLNNLTENAKNFNENAKWIGVANGYTIDDIANPPIFDTQINGISTVKLSDEIRQNTNMGEDDFSKYYVDTKGVVYYYNAEVDTLVINPVSEYSWYIGEGKTEYTISNINELVALANIVNGTAEGIAQDTFAGKKVSLTSNIDMNGVNWTPIGGYAGTYAFNGIFDGENNTISNMKVSYTGNADETIYAGLFSKIYNSEVSNIKMQNANISVTAGKVYAGVLVGYASNATISNILKFENIDISGQSNMNIAATNGNAYVGGVVGYTYNSDFDNINVDSLVIDIESNQNNVAGIAGQITTASYAETTLDNFEIAEIIINVEKGTSYMGGAIGAINRGTLNVNEVQGSDGLISKVELNSLASSAATAAGGFLGYSYKQGDDYYSQDGIYYSNDPMTVKNVTITDVDISVNNPGQIQLGGLVGWSQSFAEYYDCSVSGDITEINENGIVNTSSECGGFVGIAHDRTQSFTNCVADVNVNTSYVAGGFIGNITANGGNMNVEFYSCTAEGDVWGSNAGGFAGYVNQRNGGDAIINNCTSMGSVYGTLASGGLIGTTRADCYEIIIEDCEASQSVSGNESAKIAGVIGYVDMKEGEALTISDTTYNTQLPITNSENTDN